MHQYIAKSTYVPGTAHTDSPRVIEQAALAFFARHELEIGS
jgi:hypothetical protein